LVSKKCGLERQRAVSEEGAIASWQRQKSRREMAANSSLRQGNKKRGGRCEKRTLQRVPSKKLFPPLEGERAFKKGKEGSGRRGGERAQKKKNNRSKGRLAHTGGGELVLAGGMEKKTAKNTFQEKGAPAEDRITTPAREEKALLVGPRGTL